MKDEKFDKIVGSGNYRLAAGGYKPEGSEETQYKYGLNINLFGASDFDAETVDKLVKLAQHRIASVKAAGIFNKSGDYTDADAEAFVAGFSTVEAWKQSMEKAVREKKERVSGITPLVQAARDILENVLFVKGGIAVATATAAQVKEIRAQVRTMQKENHAWWTVALGKAEKELAARAAKAEKAVADFE
jgi:hypothetical protein